MKLDKATALGLLFSVGCIFAGLIMASGYDVGVMYKLYINQPDSFLITVGGSFGAFVLASNFNRMKDLITIVKVTTSVDSSDSADGDLIVELVGYAAEARRNGVLSLDSKTEEIKDPFVRSGIQMAVDGTAPEQIEEILTAEMDAIKRRHGEGQEMLMKWAEFGPAFGMLGTLIGLVAMLANMSDPTKIGPAMAVALITTFYGAALANMFCIPLCYKLRLRTEEEMIKKQMVVDAVLAIQNGDNPRIVQQRLMANVSPATKKVLNAKFAEA